MNEVAENSTSLCIPINISNLSSEEFLFLVCDAKERQSLLDFETRGNAPTMQLNISTSDKESHPFHLYCTDYGFVFHDGITDAVCAQNYINKKLAISYRDLDVELLRGILAMAFINLEIYVRQHFDIGSLIHCASVTDYLYRCIAYLKS